MKTKECKNCGEYFEITSSNRRNVFCGRSCANSFNNKKRVLSDETKNKISESVKKKWDEDRSVFSSGEDHSRLVGKGTKNKFKGNVKSILELSSRTVQKILKRLSLGCSRCGWKESTCDIHHINGRKIKDCNNHKNLSLLCPNCHRLVHTGIVDKSDLKTLNETIPENWVDYYYG